MLGARKFFEYAALLSWDGSQPVRNQYAVVTYPTYIVVLRLDLERRTSASRTIFAPAR